MRGENRKALGKQLFVAVLCLLVAATVGAQAREDTVEILRRIDTNWDAAVLSAWINDEESNGVPVGGKIEFHFRSAAVGYMSLAYIDSTGAAAVVVPSMNDQPELTIAGEDQVYPSPAAGFQFRAVAPAGTETAFIVLTDRPIRPSDIGEADEYGFLQSGNATELLERYVSAINALAAQGLVAVAEIEHSSVMPQQATAAGVAASAEPTIEVVDAENIVGAGDDTATFTTAEAAGDAIESADESVETVIADSVDAANENVPADSADETVEAVMADATDATDATDETGEPGPDAAVAAADEAIAVADAEPDQPVTDDATGVTGLDDVGEAIADATELQDVLQVPDVPDVPDGGDIAAATGISDIQDTVTGATEVPDVSVGVDLPDVPGSDDIADATGITTLEEGVDRATELPSLPETPTMVTTDEVLTAAGVPDVPDVPDATGVIPDVPTATDVINVPDVPTVPDASDIVDVPDVPDVPTATDVIDVPDLSTPEVPDVQGNVLGRVMSQAQSVPTSTADVKQIATATASRRVFNWVFGGSGGGSTSAAPGEPIGVSGVIANISADPDQMDALAEENPGAVGAIRMLARSGDPDRQLALTMSDLESEIEGASEVYYCTNVSDCAAIPMGRNSCGHAQKYVIYTTTTTDVGELTAKVKDYDSYDTVRRMAEGTPEAECADDAERPRLICERNICDVADSADSFAQ